MLSQPLTPLLGRLLRSVNASLGTNFNGILVNKYSSGEKYIGAHSDDERCLGTSGVDQTNIVAGISYGSTRTFRIRDKKTKKIVLDYQQESRTLIVMDGDFQKEFTHEIPIQKKVLEERISVTFRYHTR